jgi:hypothetical protein
VRHQLGRRRTVAAVRQIGAHDRAQRAADAAVLLAEIALRVVIVAV